jgi:GNAT superfamily N-acetyltransferase
MSVNIREATPNDNHELQRLQAKCPQGTKLIVSLINTPDFFARAKAYGSYKVYLAYEDNHIIGSAGCGMRKTIINGDIRQVGYEFQYFTSPGYRGKGVAKQLHKQIEDHLTQQGVVLSYLLVIEGNFPAMHLFESLGFKRHRILVMPGLALYKEVDIPPQGRIRPVSPNDLAVVAELLNGTWQGYNLYEPTSAETLIKFINRTPAFNFDNLLGLEDQDEIQACLGFWDWSQIMKITMKSLSLKMKMMGFLLDIARLFWPMPRMPKVGETLKQWCLTPIGFKDPRYLAVLLRYLNNLALQRGIQQIFCIGERGHTLLNSLKGFIHVDTAMHLYVKPLQQNVLMSDAPIFIDGIDL